MKLIVRTPAGEDIFEGAYNYETNNGELDVIVADIVSRTYARDQWLTVSREKDDEEEWPEPPVELREDEDEGQPELSGITLDVEDDEQGLDFEPSLPTTNFGRALSDQVSPLEPLEKQE